MKAYVIALAALTALASTSHAQSKSQTQKSSSFTPKSWNVVLYDNTKYRGTTKTVRNPVAKMDAKWARAKSIVIVGQWELCTGVNFTGECRQLRSSIADLKAYGFPGQIKSIRPIVLRPRG